MRGSFLISALGLATPALGLATAALGLAMATGCASTAPRIVPQTTLAAIIEVAPHEAAAEAEPAAEAAPVATRVTHPVDITVDHLPPPAAFEPHATTYVFWVRASDEDAWTNATHLDPSKSQETTTFAFPQDVLFVHVTAEATADARLPSDKIVLSTRVSRNGACASGVDQNDVTMKVRMCR